MPSTTDKRAQARKVARVKRAHLIAPEQAPARRAPMAKTSKRRTKQNFFQRYQWATTFFVLLLVGTAFAILYGQKIGPFAPPKPTPVVTKCNLSTHICDKPAMTIDPAKTYTATIKTAKGDIVLDLDAKNTPITANNFVYLARQGFYNGSYFWRVEAPGLQSPLGGASQLQLIQGGSIADSGQDGAAIPGYTIKDELANASKGYGAGTVAMANTGQPDSGSTQFFIDTGDNTKMLQPSYAVFAHVTSGLDVAKKISPKDKITSVVITEQAAQPQATPSATATPKK